jgi:FSR family fosmidomycin resistance protein-like MFS transporter
MLDLLRLRGGVLTLILLIGTFRVLPAMGLPLALAYLIKDSGGTNESIGWMQALFLAAIGIGGVACAAALKARHERLVLWLVPALVSPLLAACAMTSGWTLALFVTASGLLLGFTMPVLIGYGQLLLPEAQRLASSITMGVTWGLGAAAVQGVMANTTPRTAIFVFAIATLGSSLLCALLPRGQSQAAPLSAATVPAAST